MRRRSMLLTLLLTLFVLSLQGQEAQAHTALHQLNGAVSGTDVLMPFHKALDLEWRSDYSRQDTSCPAWPHSMPWLAGGGVLIVLISIGVKSIVHGQRSTVNGKREEF